MAIDVSKIHKRKCRDCGNVAEHSDNVVPEVLCKKCGSQDTRVVKDQATRKLDICREFSRGFADSVGLQPRKLAESDHWLAGYDAGYYCRKVKNEALDKYLVSIGHEPQAIIRPCDSVPNKETDA